MLTNRATHHISEFIRKLSNFLQKGFVHFPYFLCKWRGIKPRNCLLIRRYMESANYSTSSLETKNKTKRANILFNFIIINSKSPQKLL